MQTPVRSLLDLLLPALSSPPPLNCYSLFRVPIYSRAGGSGFSIVVEGRPGASGAPVGDSTYREDLSALPDLQIIASRDLGNGSTANRTAPVRVSGLTGVTAVAANTDVYHGPLDSWAVVLDPPPEVAGKSLPVIEPTTLTPAANLSQPPHLEASDPCKGYFPNAADEDHGSDQKDQEHYFPVKTGKKPSIYHSSSPSD